MDILEIKANEGIGPIKLVMKRDKVYRILNKSGDFSKNAEWIGDFHLEYKNNMVVFIEIPNCIANTHFVLFNGVDVFRTEAKLLVKFISDFGKYDENDRELGFSYRFPSLSIGLWRPRIFEYEMIYDPDFKKMIQENQIDEMKYLYFEAVCVFTKDYYKN